MYDPTTQTQQPIVIGEEGVLVADVVAAQPRRTPTSIPDKLPGVDFDAELAAEGAGIINIRSVYDLDGAGERQHRRRCRSRANAAGESPGAVPAHREGRCDSRRGHGRSRQHGVRPEHPAGHARSHRLRADRARRLRARQSAGQRRARDQRARRERPTHIRAPSELAAGRAGARAHVQRLPRAREQSLARSQHGVQCGVCRCNEHGHRVPEHRKHVLARRRRDDGGDAHARELPNRLRGARAERRRSLYGRLDERRAWRRRRADLVPVLEPDDDGADERQLHRRLDAGVPHRSSTTRRTFIRCGARRARSSTRTTTCTVLADNTCVLQSRCHAPVERHERGDGAGRSARPHGRRVARRGRSVQRVPRALVRRRSPDPA